MPGTRRYPDSNPYGPLRPGERPDQVPGTEIVPWPPRGLLPPAPCEPHSPFVEPSALTKNMKDMLQETRKRTAIVINADGSLSMGAPFSSKKCGHVSRINGAKFAIGECVRRLKEFYQAALVAFADQAQILHPLGEARQCRESLMGAISGLHPDGDTNMTESLEISEQLLAGVGPECSRQIIIFSDGEANIRRPELPGVAARIRQAGTTIHAFAIGNIQDIDPILEQDVASPGKYFFFDDYTSMTTHMQNIATGRFA